jgi:hypothetical protein
MDLQGKTMADEMAMTTDCVVNTLLTTPHPPPFRAHNS